MDRTEIYNDLLQHFCSKDERREDICKFIKVDENTACSTDGFVLMFVPMANSFSENMTKAVNDILPIKGSEGLFLQKVFMIDDLKDAVNHIEMIDDWSEYVVKCDDCNGWGEVEYEYISKSGDFFEKDLECPVCKGDGEIRSIPKDAKPTKIPSDKQLIKIEHMHFSGFIIQEIIYTMEKLGTDRFETIFIPHKPTKPLYIKVAECSMLVMGHAFNPNDSDYKVAFTVTGLEKEVPSE